MSDRPAPSVTGLLADLHAYRVRTMAPADLQANIDQRRLLEETADRDAFVKAGDVVEPFTLPEVLGGTVDLERLLADGPVVLLLVRLADVHPDWLVRTEADVVIDAVRALVQVAA